MSGAGALRERVRLQSPPSGDDLAGGQSGSWIDVATLWAAVDALSGVEAIDSGILTGITRYKVTLRLRAVATGQRFLWRGLQLDIRAVLPGINRADIELICDAVPA